jgi:pimeloyl-ACP methyl ester carboxylesterase
LRWDEIDVLGAARQARHPLLVVHDRGDRDVPFESGETLHAAWRGSSLKETAGLGHRRILRDASVLKDTIAFIGSAGLRRSA